VHGRVTEDKKETRPRDEARARLARKEEFAQHRSGALALALVVVVVVVVVVSRGDW
jgi:hypothetical protein